MVEFPYKRTSAKRSDSGRSRRQLHAKPNHAGTSPSSLNSNFNHARTNPSSLNSKACFSFAAYARTVITHLRKCNVPIAKALSDQEFQHIQSRFGFLFPPDLRSILQEGLPVGPGFPDWRSSSDKQLLSIMNLPGEGLCHEVSKSRFWCMQWGQKPDAVDDAVRVARSALMIAPMLVPIYSHCYISCSPNLAGNPVFFVYGKDVFYCGYDLADFFEREVFIPLEPLSLRGSRAVPYWLAKPGYGREKSPELRRNMSSINAEMVMEGRMRARHDDDHNNKHEGQPKVSLSHRGYQGNVSHNVLHQHGHKHYHPHRKADTDIDWDLVSKRLLAELQQEGNIYSGSACDVRNGDALSRKSMCEETSRILPDRMPKNLVRSAGNSPRMRTGQTIMSRYAYFHDNPLPAKVLAELTITAPPWAAKVARHIPVWSDIAENKENLSDEGNERKQSEFCAKPLMKEKATREDSYTNRNASCVCKDSKRSVVPYLKDMEKKLRGGGWKEEDITEMMVATLPPMEEEYFRYKQTRREVHDALEMAAEAMSSSLQKAGWTKTEVKEILNCEQKLPAIVNVHTLSSDGSQLKTQREHKLAAKLGELLSLD